MLLIYLIKYFYLMNFNSKFFSSGFKYASNAGKSFNTKGFFAFNMKRNICFLNNVYKGKSLNISTNLLNNVEKKNYTTVFNSNTTTRSISFLLNNTTCNGGISIMSHNINSEFTTLLNEILSLNETLLENGR